MEKDPYKKPSYSLINRFMRVLWGIAWLILFRFSPRPLHVWRIFLLRLFGAKIGANCAIYPMAKIWMPANLVCEDTVAIANGVEIYNTCKITIKSHAIISQDAYLCAASHDYNSPEFTLYSLPITIGEYAWVCARATVLPGVIISDYSVVGLGSIVSKSTIPYGVYAGSPAKLVKMRNLNDA